MRLYSRTGATRLDDPEHGSFDADAQGGFDFPDEVSDRIRGFHLHGKPLWEDDIQRQQRLIEEELERRKDPATLLSAVEALVKAAGAASALTTSAANATGAVQDLSAALQTEPPAPAAPPVVVEPVAPAAPAEAKPAAKRARKQTATKPAAD
ncbi:MAG: hypothetical protein HOY79_34025 [Streptomyces sp.]|nr:hypothetical protein [Streptomyces sp.]NUS11290.1 hypothetical protein [Streptomyces sp.]NUS23435.1 hypothetical protein [Streptomyces sp.]